MDSTTYRVKIELLEPLLGTTPKNQAIYTDYVASKAADAGLVEEELATVESIEQRGWTGFMSDESGSFIYNYLVKGFLCESARTLKVFGPLKQLQDKFKRYVFVTPRRVRLPQIAGVLERPLRAQTAQGPRVCLARSDYVDAGAELSFTLEVLGVSGITAGCVQEVLSYGRLMGLGQWRSGSFGSFAVTSFEEV